MPPTRWAVLSVAAALATIALKLAAFRLTGSVGLLSDAGESLVNLAAALMALFALWYAAHPADRDHTYGHSKIEYFASGIEGTLILVAGGGIIFAAGFRLFHPTPLAALGTGLAISLGAAAINLAVAQVLLRVAHRSRSIALEADAQHLMTDVWTTVGVVAGLGLVLVTGLTWLDPLLALVVGLHILRAGGLLLWRSFQGLMDTALAPSDVAVIVQAIEDCLEPGMTFHELRTRRSGARQFADVHVLVPGEHSVHDAHRRATTIEQAVRTALPATEMVVHVEPLEGHRTTATPVALAASQSETQT
ncbi:MAG: cation-efflux pump [Dehalococcoidia bacterium]|nr:cation-efflux pump [Dehalococcoidia bacterium]